MDHKTSAEAVIADHENSRAPDPRKHYPSPEDLLEDIDLAMEQREALLTQWKDEVDGLLAAESEGMSASDPIEAEAEARLAAEARRVNKALLKVKEANQAASA